MKIPKLKYLEVSNNTYEIYQKLCVIAYLYNDILNRMEVTFITTENRNRVQEVKTYIEKLYDVYRKKLKNEGLNGAKIYIENQNLYTLSLDDPIVTKKFMKYYPEEAEKVKKLYHDKLSYPALNTKEAKLYGTLSTHGKISIPKELRKEFIGAKSGELLFFLDKNQLKDLRVQKLDDLTQQILSLDKVMESLSFDFEITGLIELIDLEKSYIKKYAESNIGVMFIRTEDAIFELYSSEIKLREKPLPNHIRMIDRDGKLFSSIQCDSLRNQIVFKGCEQVKRNIEEAKETMKENSADSCLLQMRLSRKK